MNKKDIEPKRQIDWLRLAFYLLLFFGINSFYVISLLSNRMISHRFWWSMAMILLDIWWLRRMWIRDTENR